MTVNPQYLAAIQDFRKLRRRESLRRVFDFLTHRSGLLSYEDVRRQLRAIEMSKVKLREIPVSAIQGSVGRYTEFTRDFLPKDSINEHRWARIKTQFTGLKGLPPIEVYQIGEVYFVIDGNHRVSVARNMGIDNIDAYVREVKTKVPLQIDEDIDQILIKAELSEFLEETGFDQLYPHEQIKVTCPGRYLNILQQIEAIHFALEIEDDHLVPKERAVKRWYDTVYYPLVDLIRNQNILREYPERTETDLFLWVFKHRATLAETLGWEITADRAIKDLTHQSDSAITRLRDRSRRLIKKIIFPRQIDRSPPAGTWRQEKMASHQGRLFGNLLVVINNKPEDCIALSHAIEIANLEGSQLYGLYISNEKTSDDELEAIQANFELCCENANTPGQIAVETGSTAKLVTKRARWADLVITSKKGKSLEEFQNLIQTCPTPILVVNQRNLPLKRALLVYDGSPKSEEALFLAAYLTTFWELSLMVMTVAETSNMQKTSETFVHANEYLDQYGVPASFLETDHEPVDSILQATEEQSCDLIILGGYCDHIKGDPWCELLDQILTDSQQAILICV